MAGPAANFTIAFVSIAILRALLEAGVYHLSGTGVHSGFVYLNDGVPQNSPLAAVAFLLSKLFVLNLLLGVFNLMPLPPLDGSGVAEGLSPRGLGSLYDRLREVPGHELLGWIAASQLFRYAWQPLDHLIAVALGF
jgi:Zn-dependent protease